MGVVYQGEDTRLLRRVAIKIVPCPRTRDEKERRHLIHEARMASSMNHPNICTIYDVGQVDTWYYIVMEYVEGRTLKEIIEQRGPLPEKEAAGICAQVCSALGAAHEKGIVHRDIKPDNIMISSDGQVKIMDFGLAKLVDENSALAPPKPEAEIPGNDLKLSVSGIEGTALYMAPEQIDRGGIDDRTDIYALGAVLYELLTGEPPFRGADSVALITAILEAPTPSPDSSRPELSTAVGSAVRQALSRDPENRFQSARDFRTALEAIASPKKKRRHVSRTFWLLAAIFFTLGLVVILGRRGRLRGNDIKVINIRELQPTDQPTGTPVLSPDGSRFAYLARSFAADSLRQNLIIEDLQTGRTKLLHLNHFRNDVLFQPTDWSPDMKWLLLSTDAGLEAIDTSGTQVRKFHVFGHQARWSPDGRRIVFARFDPSKLTQKNEIWLVDVASKNARLISPDDGRSYASPWWASDSRWLVCVGGVGSNRALWFMDTQSRRTKRFLSNEMGAEAPVWSGSGNHIYFMRTGSELWRVKVDPASLAAMTPPEQVFKNTNITGFSLSKSGKRLVFSQRTLTEELWRFHLPLDTGNPWQDGELLLRPQNWGSTNLAVAPTGNFFVLETGIGQRRILMQLDFRNGAHRVLYDARDAYAPTISSDSKWVAFDSGGGNNADIWQVSLEDRKVKKLFECPGADWMPRYAPDGRALSFVSNRDGQFDIWLFDLKDQTFKKVTNTSEMESAGYWSRDGRKLAFFRNKAAERRSGVWVVDLSSGSETQVYHIPHTVIDVTTTIAWGPEDKTLFFSDGHGLRQLDLVTGESRRPLDTLWHRTEHDRYTVRGNTLYVIQRTFVSDFSIAEVREKE